MATDYQKHLDGWKHDEVNNPVTCGNADVSSSHMANLWVKELRCEENAVISVDSSATLGIGKLICKNGKLNVSYSSTLNIFEIDCMGTLDIQCSYSSTIMLGDVNTADEQRAVRASNIGTTTGLVRYSSTARCYFKIGRDGVGTEYSSQWVSDPSYT
jgi:hypothetical protein